MRTPLPPLRSQSASRFSQNATERTPVWSASALARVDLTSDAPIAFAPRKTVNGAPVSDVLSLLYQSSAAHDLPMPSSPSNATTPWPPVYHSSSLALIAARGMTPYSLAPRLWWPPRTRLRAGERGLRLHHPALARKSGALISRVSLRQLVEYPRAHPFEFRSLSEQLERCGKRLRRVENRFAGIDRRCANDRQLAERARLCGQSRTMTPIPSASPWA